MVKTALKTDYLYQSHVTCQSFQDALCIDLHDIHFECVYHFTLIQNDLFQFQTENDIKFTTFV